VKHIPQLKNAVGIEHWKGLYNSLGGWTHARKALEKWAAEAEQMGVKFLSGPGGTMTGLELDDSGSMTGIRVASGDVLQADHYILSAGAASPQLLPELSKQLWSKCWTLGHIQLTDEEAAEWKGVPVIDHYELGFMFEPDLDTSKLKNPRNALVTWLTQEQNSSRSAITILDTKTERGPLSTKQAIPVTTPSHDTPVTTQKMASHPKPK
jgi:sarcosine oxidase/L-pipecolate oxidase